jgi:hypothetical protein
MVEVTVKIKYEQICTYLEDHLREKKIAESMKSPHQILLTTSAGKEKSE